jgi:hypothetical protein
MSPNGYSTLLVFNSWYEFKVEEVGGVASPTGGHWFSHRPGVRERVDSALSLKILKAQDDKVIDAYVNEAMDLTRYNREMDKLADGVESA